jgi:GNAT superfamily N-acetyltransferase
MQWFQSPFVVSTDKARLQIDVVHAFLRTSYWSPGIQREVVERVIAGSMCFGVYKETEQVGFARVISDGATFAYLADVFVLPSFRGLGLSKFLMACIKQHPELQNLRRWILATADAHGLYKQFGFVAVNKPERLMEIVDADVYRRLAAERGVETRLA